MPNITESFQIYAREATPDDGRWIFVDASPTEVVINTTARTCSCDLTALRKLRAVIDHIIEAETVTQASAIAAVEAEFANDPPPP